MVCAAAAARCGRHVALAAEVAAVPWADATVKGPAQPPAEKAAPVRAGTATAPEVAAPMLMAVEVAVPLPMTVEVAAPLPMTVEVAAQMGTAAARMGTAAARTAASAVAAGGVWVGGAGRFPPCCRVACSASYQGLPARFKPPLSGATK